MVKRWIGCQGAGFDRQMFICCESILTGESRGLLWGSRCGAGSTQCGEKRRAWRFNSDGPQGLETEVQDQDRTQTVAGATGLRSDSQISRLNWVEREQEGLPVNEYGEYGWRCCQFGLVGKHIFHFRE